MSLLERAQELVGKAKHAAGRFTRDRDPAKPRQIQDDGRGRISEAARDAKDRYRRS